MSHEAKFDFDRLAAGRLTLDGKAVATGRFIGLDDLGRLAWTAGEGQFIRHSGDGFDTITDFDAIGADHDVLDLSGLASIRSFRDLKEDHLHREGSMSSSMAWMAMASC